MLHQTILRISDMSLHDRSGQCCATLPSLSRPVESESVAVAIAAVGTESYAQLKSSHSLAGIYLLLKPLHKASQNRRDIASLQSHLNKTKAIFQIGCIQRRAQVPRSMDLESAPA